MVWCVGRRDSSGVEGRIDVTEDCTEHREERKGEEMQRDNKKGESKKRTNNWTNKGGQ